MTSQLEQLKTFTTVVADTADFGLLAQYKPEDATTNPSLVLAGSQLPQYAHLVKDAITYARENAEKYAKFYPDDKGEDLILNLAVDKLTVSFGLELLKVVPGRVSTEVDAKLSFDKEKMVTKAKLLIELYKEAGVEKDRIYIKLASTWEGIQAGRELETLGINCNLTLLFSFAQAVACAQANVSLISPFVGRILDWYKKEKSEEAATFVGEKHPGVASVKAIYNYFKRHGYKTIVMGASFRSLSEITELVGCDKLTIAPRLLEELAANTTPLTRRLDPAACSDAPDKIPPLTRADFLFMHNEDPMAVEKTAEGIRNFNKDTRKLEKFILSQMGQ